MTKISIYDILIIISVEIRENKNKNKKMENQTIQACDGSEETNVPFGEKFAYLAITATIAYTYMVINVMSYIS
ncbi:hypothetical protein KAJ61_02005 [Candidatus Parcubacteria bacterium]|nr:hypothetical protein [Candidatus Parcubacteria bacterium]